MSGIQLYKTPLLALALILSLSVSLFGQSKKAQKYLQKGDFDKLTSMLDKDLSKNPTDPHAEYAYSLLYLTPQYTGYNIDSAYAYILAAIDHLPLQEEKSLKKLAKRGVVDSTLALQQKQVEQHAFARAKDIHSIQGYNDFLSRFAPASQVDSATSMRNTIAYNDAVQANTHEAYYNFLQTYPQAVQVPMARQRYDDLLYKTKTTDGKLESYIQFLRNNPDSPFRDNAELQILSISTADHSLESYMSFIERFPNSKWRQRALNFMYHRFKAIAPAEEFTSRFDILNDNDSLAHMADADAGFILPIVEMGRYGFMQNSGRKLIDFAYQHIDPEYLCGHITDDVLKVVLNDRPMVVSRMGNVLVDTLHDAVADIGAGLLKVHNNRGWALVHKSGLYVSDFLYEDAELLANTFVKVKQDGKWGLITAAGRALLPVVYDQIFSEGPFIIIENDGRLAVQNFQTISRSADLQAPQLSFLYHDYLPIDDEHLLVLSGDREGIIDRNLHTGIDLDAQKITRLFDGWLLKKSDKYSIYDRDFRPTSEVQFHNVLHSHNKAALKLGGKWALFVTDSDLPSAFMYDSVSFLSDKIGLLYRGDSTLAIFDNDSIVDISATSEIRLLKGQSVAIDDNTAAQYLLTKSKAGMVSVYDANGHIRLSGRYDAVNALGEEYLLVERNGKKGLYHKSGEEVLNTKYEAIGNYSNGAVSTLLNGKFGIYNHRQNLLMSAKYEKMLRPYSQQYFLGTKNGKMAFIDRDNKSVTDFEFDKIDYWTDTTALVQRDDLWNIYDIKNKKALYDGIAEYVVLGEHDDVKTILITKNGKEGVISTKKGEVVGPTFNDIVNLGTAEKPVYFVEKYIAEAEFYVVLYYDADGQILRKQVFNQDEYDQIYCE
jgi:hypothetical protein